MTDCICQCHNPTDSSRKPMHHGIGMPCDCAPTDPARKAAEQIIRDVRKTAEAIAHEFFGEEHAMGIIYLTPMSLIRRQIEFLTHLRELSTILSMMSDKQFVELTTKLQQLRSMLPSLSGNQLVDTLRQIRQIMDAIAGSTV